MKKIMLLAFMCFMSLLFADTTEESKSEFESIVRITVDVEDYFTADECYVIFFLEATADTMTNAKNNIDEKCNSISQKIKSKFPKATLGFTTVNMGHRDIDSSSATASSGNTFLPTIMKVLICTLPPNENMATKLLDYGVNLRLTPFLGKSDDLKFGSIFWGLNDTTDAKKHLQKKALEEIKADAKIKSALLNRNFDNMFAVTQYYYDTDPYMIEFRDIEIPLPAIYCSNDKNKIKLSFSLTVHYR